VLRAGFTEVFVTGIPLRLIPTEHTAANRPLYSQSRAIREPESAGVSLDIIAKSRAISLWAALQVVPL